MTDSIPHPQNNPNLDPVTRNTLRIIDLEKNLENLTKRWLENDVSLMTEIREWENRVKVLEEARQLQIKLNAVFERKSDKEIEKHISFWDRFYGK